MTSSETRGWVLYDGECGFCQRWARAFSGMLKKREFELAPLQEPWVAERLEMPLNELLADIRLLTRDGVLLSGADVHLFLMRRIWWAWPLFAIFSLPGFNALFRWGYR